ncbi:ankyrin repeat and protein kinase domain-containing protein 1 isoform 2-T2 [Pholidichthys leucotaenia]
MDGLDRTPKQFRNFKKNDFEADWIKVAECRFGQVYQVKVKVWREKCALKCYDTTLCGENFYRRVTEEASNFAKMKFKYIISIYGVCSEATGVVMEYLSTGSLNNLLSTHTVMWPKKFQMIHETSLGMNFLHSMKPSILHLNLKTSNILLDDHLHIKISDFGLIHWEKGMSNTLFLENLTVRGNISYIPPETFTQCPNPPGAAFDVYSFGIVMWEILTQQKPYAEIVKKTEALNEIMKIPWQVHINGEEQKSEYSWLVSPTEKITFPGISGFSSDNEHDKDDILGLLFKKDFGSFTESVRREHVHKQFSGKKNLLHYTVASGDLESVRRVLNLGAEVNCTTARGYTPLIVAVLHRMHAIISLLLERGADVTQGDDDHWTPLHFAAQNGDDRTVRLLMDKGAAGDAREKVGWMPLHLACQNGHEAVVRLLLSRLPQEVVFEREETQGRMPLHLASAYGHLNIVKLLLTQGADPNSTDRFLTMALHLSAEKGYNRVVRQLVKSGANTDRADSKGYTPLHLAALKGHTGICRQLLSNGANPDSKTLHGWTPMHLAALKGHDAAVVQLSQGGCVNARGENGWTPLHLACQQSEAEVVAKLLTAKADPNIAEDSDGWTPLHVACNSVSFPIVLHLISHHADVNVVNSAKATPLHLAAQHGCVPIVKALLLNGADRMLLDSSGSTARDVAQRCENLKIMQLLENGC